MAKKSKGDTTTEETAAPIGKAIKLTVSAKSPLWRGPMGWDKYWQAGETVSEVNGGAILHCVLGAGSVLATLNHLELGQWRIISFFRPSDMPMPELEVPGHG